MCEKYKRVAVSILTFIHCRLRRVPQGEGVQDRDDERQEQGLLHVAPLPGPVRRNRPGPQAGQPPQAVSGEVRAGGVFYVHNQS